MNLAAVGLLSCAVERAAVAHQEVELDLSGVAFCDVIGATAIELAQHQLQVSGRRLILRGIDRSLHILLAVDGVFSSLQRSVGPRDTAAPTT